MGSPMDGRRGPETEVTQQGSLVPRVAGGGERPTCGLPPRPAAPDRPPQRNIRCVPSYVPQRSAPCSSELSGSSEQSYI